MKSKYNQIVEHEGRTLRPGVSVRAQAALERLIDPHTDAQGYRSAMTELGEELGKLLTSSMENTENIQVLVSTAEDADFLSLGIAHELSRKDIEFKTVVLWNNHYTPCGSEKSVAPIVNSFFEQGYEQAKNIIICKSVLSGSCVVRTNIIELIDRITPDAIFILAPVMHQDAENKLRAEFPTEISSIFNFVYFALDTERLETGEVLPGIGGQVYTRLGLQDQPVKTGYLPDTVRRLLEEPRQ